MTFKKFREYIEEATSVNKGRVPVYMKHPTKNCR